MVFTSLVFLYLFLPLVLLLYFPQRTIRARNMVLAIMSLTFYAWGEPVWIVLLLASTRFDWTMARLIERWRGTDQAKKAKLALIGSLIANLSLLGVFKYASLITTTINDATGWHLVPPANTLPVGISFYTFETISYVIDVYRGEVKAERSYLNFVAFISLFFRLVAGPIVRYAHIDQELNGRDHSASEFSRGLHRVCVGLFKKVCIANVAGEWVRATLDSDLSTLSVADGWIGLFMFTIQIYFDFSAYSDMAIGLGWMFGFHFHENFNHPYISKSISEFWRRWHISLSSFFRDYVYIPLGGKERKPYRNLFIVWALTGIWHGASWNFMLWGLYNGLFIAIERLFLKRVLEALPRPLQHAYCMAVVVVGWSLFYFTSFDRLGDFFLCAFGQTNAALWGTTTTADLWAHAFWIGVTLVMCAPIGAAFTKLLDTVQTDAPRLAIARAAAVVFVDVGILFVATSLLVGKSYNPFLYFRF